jgi:hypothetical protein
LTLGIHTGAAGVSHETHRSASGKLGAIFNGGETRDEDQFKLLGVDGRSEKTTGKQNRRKT